MLELEDEVRVRGAAFVIDVFRELKEEDVAQEIEDRFFDRRVAPFCGRDRAFDYRAIGVAHRLARRDVGPVNRKTGNRFTHRAAERLEREIAEPPVLLREPVEHAAENVDVIREREAHHEPLLRVNEMAEVHRVADEAAERFRDRLVCR